MGKGGGDFDLAMKAVASDRRRSKNPWIRPFSEAWRKSLDGNSEPSVRGT